MVRPLLVLLIGDSLLMEGVALSLGNRPQLNVLQLDPALIALKDCLHCLEPHLILVEMGASWADTLLSRSAEEPDLPLAGLDVDTCRLVVPAGRQFRTSTMEDLLRVIEQEARRQGSPEQAVRAGG